MSNYTKTTNFATKDNLSPGNPLKIVKGTEIDTEYNNIATAVATKTDNSAAAITGGTIVGITDLAVADGGTGASNAANARSNLSAAASGANSDITSLTGLTTPLTIAQGGTTASTAAGARTSLGLVIGTDVLAPNGSAASLTSFPTFNQNTTGNAATVTTNANLTGGVTSVGNAATVVTNANLTGAVTSSGNATSLGSFTSANLLAALTDETGTGSAVFATNPVLVTPNLGTPSAAVLTSATGLPLSSGVTGTLPVVNGGTGTATPSIVAGTNVTVTGSWPNQTVAASGGSGTVTSVALSGGTTGLTVSGSPITTSGTITVAGTLAVANGGTGDTSYTNGQLLIGNTTGNTLTKTTLTAGTGVTITNGTGSITIAASGGSGDVVGPASATDNAITRFDLTTGKLVQNSLVTVADDGAITAPQVGSVIPFYYANQAAFPSASTYHGALAHSHADGAMFFAHGGAWIRLLDGAYTTTATAAGTTTLSASSSNAQFFTGTAAQTIVLPVASTLALGQTFNIHNNSTGDLTVNSSGSNLVVTVTANTTCLITCILTSGTSAASFDADFTGFTSTLPIARGGTGASTLAGAGIATLTGTETLTNKTLTAPALGTPVSGQLSACTVDGTDAVGFRNIPQNSQSTDYTLVLADQGKHIFHPVADNNARTFTIPANSSVAYPIGTALTFINMAVAVVSIAITTDTLTLSSAGTTGTRSLAQYGSATCIKITSTEWLISGSGLT